MVEGGRGGKTIGEGVRSGDCCGVGTADGVCEGFLLRLRIRRAVVMRRVKKRASVKTGVE